MGLSLANVSALAIRQRVELGELALGFETRNKYEVTAGGAPVAFVAEQGKGLLAMLFRQTLGHWRTFALHVFGPDRAVAAVAEHPFRFFFQRLEVRDSAGKPLGAIQQRFGLIRRRFDVLDASGKLVAEMSSPFWKIWTFPLYTAGREVATIKKRWSGIAKEMFTDADNFAVELTHPALTETERLLFLLAAIFVDLLYFEKKAGNNR